LPFLKKPETTTTTKKPKQQQKKTETRALVFMSKAKRNKHEGGVAVAEGGVPRPRADAPRTPASSVHVKGPKYQFPNTITFSFVALYTINIVTRSQSYDFFYSYNASVVVD
jgi:hypothetical protein